MLSVETSSPQVIAYAIRTTSYHYEANYDEIEKPLSEQL